MNIKDIPEEIRPREKAIRLGIEELSDQELLALIIGSGVSGHSALEIADELLSSHFNSLASLSLSNFEALKAYKGLNDNNSLKLLATFEFHKRLNSPKYLKPTIINSPDEVYLRYKYLEDYEQEVLILLILDNKFKLKKEKMLYKGTNDSFSINVSEVLKELVVGQAKAFILIHNHPDQSQNPSKYDIAATSAIKKSANHLSIKLLDHLIIYKGGYYSFRKINNHFTN